MPCPISVSAACFFFPGSNQLLIQMTVMWIFGFTERAPIVYALMLRTTSGIGTDATKPSAFVFVT